MPEPENSASAAVCFILPDMIALYCMARVSEMSALHQSTAAERMNPASGCALRLSGICPADIALSMRGAAADCSRCRLRPGNGLYNGLCGDVNFWG